MNNKEKKHSIKIESNQKLGITVGKAEEPLSTEEHELQTKITNSISQSLNNICTTWINNYLEAITKDKYTEAYNIFEENKGLLIFSQSKTDLENLRKLNYRLLDKEKQKNYLMYLISFTSKLRVSDEIFLNDITYLLDEFSIELEKDFIQNLKLEKANIAAQNQHFNTATSIYKKILTDSDTSSGTLAWTYQGLSLIADNNEDKIYYTEKAQDKHLEAGNIFEAIKNIISISDLYSNTNPNEAIKLLDLALSLNKEDTLINQELLASLLFKKASYLNQIGNKEKAYEIIKESCNLREGLLHNEIQYYSSLYLAFILAKENNDISASKVFENKMHDTTKYIKDENFTLRQELANHINKKREISQTLEQKIINSKDNILICNMYLIKSFKTNLHQDKKLELLDKAMQLAKKVKDNELIANIYFSIAEVYRNEDEIDDAFTNYKSSLKYNFYFNDSFQNCISMLIDNKKWDQAEILIEERINRVGELPNICYIYGKVLYEKGNYQKAFKYLKQANKEIKEVNDYLLKCIENISDEELDNKDKTQITNIQKDISINELYLSLKEFSISISSDSRMHFWQWDKTKNDYKWTSNPEELSKQFLIQFLNAKFGKDNIEILQETRAGAGFIDLYIILNGGLKVIIELKMCGGGYSSSYAVSGKDQIIHYQKNRNTKIGFLIIFDARKRDFAKELKEVQTLDGHTIFSVAIDMRTNVK